MPRARPARTPLVRFEQLATIAVGALRVLGLEPTGRDPRHYDVTFDDLNDGVSQLENCDHELVINPFYEG